MKCIQFLNSLRPAIPMSAERPNEAMSTGELKRHVLINGERVAPEEPIDFPVFRLVFFPKSDKRGTTIV